MNPKLNVATEQPKGQMSWLWPTQQSCGFVGFFSF